MIIGRFRLGIGGITPYAIELETVFRDGAQKR